MTFLFWARNNPTADAVKPIRVNTKENPRTKANIPATTLLPPFPLFISITFKPETYPRYAGTRGRTQGERKDKSPATKDIIIPPKEKLISMRMVLYG